MENGYEFDVAFSLVDENSSLVREIIKGFKSKIKYFFFWDNQKDVVKESGPVVYASVFKERARLVVVILNEKWGKTEYTRLELSAIESAFLKRGPEFLLFVTTDNAKPPVWYGEQIYANISRNSPSEIASIIEYQITKLKGVLLALSDEDKMRALTKKKQERFDLEGYLSSSVAREDCTKEFEKIIFLSKQKQLVFADNKHSVAVNANIEEGEVALMYKYLFLYFRLFIPYHNVLHNHHLSVQVGRGDFYRNGPPDYKPTYYYDKKYSFSKSGSRVGWLRNGKAETFMTTDNLFDSMLHIFIDKFEVEDSNRD